MQRWRGLGEVPSGWGRCVLTIGVFDGVHRGHAQLIARAVSRARERGLPCVLVTFDPHPAELVRPGSHPAQLSTLTRRAELVEALGVDAFCVLPFTRELSRVSPEAFVHQVLVERLHAAEVVVGQNFTFGHKAAGNVELLSLLGPRYGFTVDREALLADAENSTVAVSSTYVRSCVDAGDVAAAAAALGRPHRVEGVVVRGDGRGRGLGYPTANVAPPMHSAIPGDGVYAAWFTVLGAGPETGTVVPGEPRRAAVSIGTNPTFSGRARTVEAFVLDTEADLYGQHVALDFVARLRGMQRFDSVTELLEAMAGDTAAARAALTTAPD
ncbi:MAG: bifunctional riboflavin kinase/FAD synthetase [Mycobacteriaceae bacterium]